MGGLDPETAERVRQEVLVEASEEGVHVCESDEDREKDAAHAGTAKPRPRRHRKREEERDEKPKKKKKVTVESSGNEEEAAEEEKEDKEEKKEDE